MTSTSLRSALAAVLVLAAAGLAAAQPASAPAPAPTKASSTDQRFVQQAGAGGAAEVALGKLATQKSTRDDVKQFGQQMVDDHTKANDELKRIAGAKGMTPPEAPTPAQQKVADRLAQRSATAFDKSYLNQMVLDHERTIALFKREARSGSDAELKAFATKTLPALEGHLTMVRAIQTKGGPRNRAVNAESGAASAPR